MNRLISAQGFDTKTVFTLELYIKEQRIGTAKRISFTQRRDNVVVGGVGIGDRILEVVPGRSTYSITLDKVSLWKKPIEEILGYPSGTRMLAFWQTPVTIKTLHYNPNNDEVYDTLFVDSVIKSHSIDFSWENDVTIIDKLELDCRKVESTTLSLADIEYF